MKKEKCDKTIVHNCTEKCQKVIIENWTSKNAAAIFVALREVALARPELEDMEVDVMAGDGEVISVISRRSASNTSMTFHIREIQ